MTEDELIISLRNGEEPAFRELVTRFQDRVFNTAFGLLQNQEDAEDIAQEVFIQVYRSIQQFKGDSLLSTWIYRITVTKSLDHLRSKKRKKRFGFVKSLFGESNKPLIDPGDFNHPGIIQEKKEDAALLFRMVDELPENQRIAFILNKVEELSYREIADIIKTAAPDFFYTRLTGRMQRELDQKRKTFYVLRPVFVTTALSVLLVLNIVFFDTNE